MKQLIYISNAVLPSKTANSIHVMKMCNAFFNNGFSVSLIAPKINSECERKRVFEYYGIEANFKIFYLSYFRFLPGVTKSIFYSFLAAIFTFNKDAVIYGRNIIGCLLSILMGKEVVLELHSPPSKFTKFEQFIFKYTLKRKPMKLVVISNALKDILRKELNGFALNCTIHVHHDGADIPKLNLLKLKEEIDSDTINIGYLGHLYPGRGIEIIVGMAKQLPAYQFHIIGGESSDIEYWKTNLESVNIKFHGHQPPEIAELFRVSMDILLAPYQQVVSISGKGDTSSYMSPLKVFEYMASRKPFIISDLPVLREVLTDDDCYFVKFDDVSQWVFAVNSILSRGDIAEAKANSSFDKLLGHYSWLKRADNISKVFRDS